MTLNDLQWLFEVNEQFRGDFLANDAADNGNARFFYMTSVSLNTLLITDFRREVESEHFSAYEVIKSPKLF